nr:3alpha-hydroxysteroid dehydrogenase-like [Nerophis lumbriciformis]
MDMKLKDRVVVVTGGTSGIGLATVEQLLREGARVVFCGRHEERIQQTLTELSDLANEDQLLGKVCNVLDDAQVGHLAQATEEQFGCCDALINNAGGGRVSTFGSTTDSDWVDETQLKLFSVIYPVRAFMPLLERSSQAAIVVVNSLLAHQPEPHMVATSSARAGLLNLTHSMAREFAPKQIRVNSVLLGTVSSEQWRRRHAAIDGEQSYTEYLAELATNKGIPLGRFGEPEEVARTLTFLASPASSYTSGASIDVSGGLARQV